jgi:dienelactone hydrolase
VSRARKVSIAIGVPLVVLTTGLYAAHDYIRAAAFVVEAVGMDGAARAAAALETNAFDERALHVPWRGGELKARLFVPRASIERAVVLSPGVHASGIDEPRLVEFARDLASVRHAVLAIELPDLTRYRITPVSTDMIEDAAAWLAAQPTLARDGRVGIMGISFAGGLSIVASSRPAIRDRVDFVMSFGGHGDLPRTLRYLCTGTQPDGTVLPPHDYGVVIILHGVADRLVPGEQVEPLRTAILTFLEASRLDMVDKTRSLAAFARARDLAAALPEPARGLMTAVNSRDVATLGPILLPHVGAMGSDPALSPNRAAAPAGTVYLLHGADDNVIPAIESRLLAGELRARGVRVRQLATPLITHAEVDRDAALSDIWDLVRFWAALLDE